MLLKCCRCCRPPKLPPEGEGSPPLIDRHRAADSVVRSHWKRERRIGFCCRSRKASDFSATTARDVCRGSLESEVPPPKSPSAAVEGSRNVAERQIGARATIFSRLWSLLLLFNSPTTADRGCTPLGCRHRCLAGGRRGGRRRRENQGGRGWVAAVTRGGERDTNPRLVCFKNISLFFFSFLFTKKDNKPKINQKRIG